MMLAKLAVAVLAVGTVLPSIAFATNVGPCVCGTSGGCDSTTFTVTDAPLRDQVKITFSTPGSTDHIVYRERTSSKNAGSSTVCIWPCEGTWGDVVNCSDLCCSCGPCPS